MEITPPTLEHRRKAFRSLRKGFISETSFNMGWSKCDAFYKAQLPKPYENEITKQMKTPFD